MLNKLFKQMAVTWTVEKSEWPKYKKKKEKIDLTVKVNKIKKNDFSSY
jgi:hypothetical protein